MALASLTLIVISVVLAVYFYVIKRFFLFNYWHLKNVPYLKPSFPFGNLKGVGKEIHISQVIRNVYNEFKNTGAKFCGVYFWNRPVAIILDLDLMKNILVKDFNNFTDRGIYYNEMDDPLSANLFTVDGDDWRKLRKKFTPAFSSGKMKHMFPTLIQMGERLHETLNEMVANNENIVEIKSLMVRFTCDVIGTCAFGIEGNSLRDPNAEFIRMGKIASNPHRHGPLIVVLKASFKNIARKLRIKTVRDDVSDFFLNVTHETVKQRKENNISRNDLMDILLKMKNQESTDASDAATLNEIAAQVFVFFVAAFETTSSTLTFCLYELARNSDIQMKCRQEIRDAYKKYGDKFEYEMLMDMPYIEQVIQETLRKYPQATTINRFAINDYAVPGTDNVFEKGTWIKIPVIAIQHDSEYYPNPDLFDPDRFDKEQLKNRNPMTSLIFGEGPRSCIGIRFAMMEMKICLGILLANFEICVCSKTIDSIKINVKHPQLCPNDDVFLKLHPIKS